MGVPTFGLAMLWDAKASPAKAKELVEALDSYWPASSTSNLALTLFPAMACFHFSVQFSAYARGTLAQVDTEVQKSGGRFIELLRIPEEKREAFRLQFLMPARGEPSSFSTFSEVARAVHDHLAKITSQETAVPRGQKQSSPKEPYAGFANARQQPRYNVNLEVEFSTESDFVKEHALNLSKGGVFIKTKQRPPLNSELGLKLRLPNGQVIETHARVVHVVENPLNGGLGLSFAGDDPVFAKNLEKYLATLEKK